jgi:hypothetical protein
MTALMTVVFFFFVLLIIYPAAAAALSLYSWIKKRQAIRDDTGGAIIAQIDETTDRLKNRWFIISVVLAFFVIAPFLVFLMILKE